MWSGLINSISQNPVSKNNPDGLTFTLVYTVTDGVSTTSIPEANVSATPPDDIKSSCIRIVQNAVDMLNKKDAQKAAAAAVDLAGMTGPLDTVKATVEAGKPKDPPPTQDQLDQAAFQQLVTDYNLALSGESYGVPVPTDSATLLAQIQKAFKPEYLVMLGRRF